MEAIRRLISLLGTVEALEDGQIYDLRVQVQVREDEGPALARMVEQMKSRQ